ncbi:MAG: helix-turn-helix domain-containing protein [Verrucomicrobia subdivision 3 bacterium]|nr:helix-turn-helix domain-containing protein [Limisphaerales bacterium]
MNNPKTSGDTATNDLAPETGALLTSRELAHELKISIRTLLRWRAAGLPSMGKRKMTRYDLGEVRPWVRNYLGSAQDKRLKR